MKLQTASRALKLKRPEPSEADIQRSIVAALRLRGWLCIRINANHAQRGRDFVRSYIVYGVPSGGFPDLLALRDAGDGTTRAVLLEVKRPGGALRSSQETFRAFAGAHGVAVHVVHDAREALAAIEGV